MSTAVGNKKGKVAVDLLTFIDPDGYLSVAPVAGLLPRFPASRTTMPDDSLRPLLRHRIVVSAPGRLLALPGLV